jgi:hypothetical protein
MIYPWNVSPCPNTCNSNTIRLITERRLLKNCDTFKDEEQIALFKDPVRTAQ